MSGESNKKKNEMNQIQPAGEHVRSQLQGSNANTNAMSSTHNSHQNSQEYNATASCQMTASTTTPLSGQYTNQSNIDPSCQKSQTDDESKKSQSSSDDLQAGGTQSSGQRKDSLSKPPSRQNSNQSIDGASSQQKESPSRPTSRQNSNQSSKRASRQNSLTDDELKTGRAGNTRPGSSTDDDNHSRSSINKDLGDLGPIRTPYIDNITQSSDFGSGHADVNEQPFQTVKNVTSGEKTNNGSDEDQSPDTWTPGQDYLNDKAEDNPDKLVNSVHVPSQILTGNQQQGKELVPLWNVVEFIISLTTPSGVYKFTPKMEQFEKAVLQFLILEKNSIKTLLKEKFKAGAKVKTQTGKLEFELVSTKDVNSGDVTKDALERLQALTKQLLAMEIVIQGDDYVPLICTDILPTINMKKVHIYTEQDKLIIVGFRPDADNVYRHIKQKLSSQPQKYQTIKIPFKHCSYECFQQLKIMTALQTLHPSVKISLLPDGHCFEGEEKEVENCIGDFHKNEQRIQFAEEKFPKHFLDLLQRPETKTYIYKSFQEKNLDSHYEVDTSSEMVSSFALSKLKANDALQCIRNCFSEMTVNRVDDPFFILMGCNSWQAIVSFNKDKKLLKQEEKDKLVFFGTRDVIIELHEVAVQQAKSQLELIQPQEDAGNTHQPPILKRCIIEIPKSVQYFLDTNKQWAKQVSVMVKHIPGAEIQTEKERKFLHIEGTEPEVEKSVKTAKSLLEDLQVKKTEDVSEAYHYFFNRKEVQMYFSAILREKGLFVFITTTSAVDSYKIHLIGTDDTSVSNTWKTIRATIKEESYSVGITKRLQEKLSQVENDFQGKAMLVGNDVGCDTLDVFSTSDVHDIFLKKIKEVIESDDATEQYCEKTLNARKEKVEFITPWLQQIAEKYEVPVKSIQHRPDLSTVMITGTKESSKQISEELVKKFSSVNISCVLLEGNDTDYFQRTNEDKTIARKNNCNLQITGRQTKAARCYVEQDNHVLVEIVCARTTDMEVDVIVCPTNDCLFSIGDMDEVLKDDRELMEAAQKYCSSHSKKFSIGEILFVDASPSYMTHTVALCVFSERNSNDDSLQSIKIAVAKILEKCSSLGLQRIAIPIQIFEDQPVQHQAQAIYKSVKSAITNKTTVNEIYLCFLDPCILDLCCSEAACYFHPNYDSYDWSALNVSSNISSDLKKDGSSSISVSVVSGVLVDQPVDILVNTVGSHLDLKQGFVSQSILKKAGPTIQQECKSRYPQGIGIGQVIMTSSGNLTTCKKICHGVLPEWMPRANFSLKILKQFVWQCLLVADSEGFKSIAFPALGTGKLKYPHYAVAETMFQVAEDFGRQRMGTSVQTMLIVVYRKDPRSEEVFYSYEKERKKGFLQQPESLKDTGHILESRFSSTFGSVCLQVVPMEPGTNINEQLVTKFVSSVQTTEGMEMRPEDNRFALYASKYLEIKKVITECLLQNHDLRLTSVAIILDDNRMKHIAQDVKAIKEAVYDDQANPYLQILRIYIKSRTQFDGFLEDKCKEIDKELGKLGSTLGFVKRAVSTASSFLRQKQLPPWKKVFLQGKDKQQYLVITGNSSDVMKTRKRIIDIVQERKQPKVWYYVDTMKAKYRFNDHICKRLNLAGSAFEGEQVVKVKDEENQLWEFDLKKMKCTRDKISYTLKHEEVTESSVDPSQEDIDDTNRNSGFMEASGSIIKECTFEINPVLKQKQFKGKILNMLQTRNIHFNETTFEITGSFEEMTSLNQQIINDFGIETGVFSKDENVISAKRTNNQMKSNWKPKPDVKSQHVVDIKIPYMEYRMLKFFCPECQLFKGSPTYENGVLRKLLQVDEKEDEMKAILQSKSLYFQSLTTFDVPMPEGWTITEVKLKEVETELNIISSEIFCFRSKDAKTLTLKGNQYEKLQMAKTKCEFILGIKQKGRGGRRDRVISTDPSYKKEGDEQMGNKSFSQSMTPSRSSFSQSFGGGSSSPSAPPPSADTFKTSEGLLIHVYVGNILNLKVDCIVNAANETLSHGGGVADVISRAAGYGFQQESDDYIQRNGQLNVTDCCTTSAGNLSYQCVIHAVGPRWYTYTDKRKCANDLEETVKNCFKVAEIKKMTSVAIPAISSGIFGVPREVCCTQYCKAVKNYSNIFGQATCLREIHFMDKDAFMVGLIQKEFKQNLNIDQSVQSSGSRVSNPSGHSLSKNDNTPTFTRSLSDDAAKAGKYSGSTNGKNSNPSSSVKQEKFQKQYMTSKGFKVHVVQDDITKMSVDVIICPQDDFCLSKGRIAKAIANASNERYRADVIGMKTVKRSEVKKIAASPSTLPFKYVLHTVAPRWDKDAVKDNTKFMKELGLTIRNILKHCSDSKNISTAAIPVLGIGADGYDTPYVTYASILSKEIKQELQNDKFSMQELYIVTSEWGMALAVTDQLDKEILFSPCTSFQRRKRHNKDDTDGTDEDKDGKRNRNSTTGAIPKSGTGKLGTTVRGGNLDNCVICMDTPDDPRRLQCGHVYCHSCISQHFKINNPVCPTCGSIQGVVTGNQPPGTMKVYRRSSPLSGYPGCGRIEIEYIIDSGRQGPEHRDEGQTFEGIRRIGYLPDNRKGQLVAKMLRVAFDRKLVFTIGDSRTTGKQGVVTWNDIHHKTNPKPYEQFGYPDDFYLDRVIDELSAKGVTEKDIGPNTSIY